MDRVNKFLGNILSRTISVDLHTLFGNLDKFITSVEKEGKRLIIRVSNPTVLFVLRRMEDKVKGEFSDIEEVRFLLSK